MYIAMNRFKIVRGLEAEFESAWAKRDSHLEDVPGFKEFHLTKGPTYDDYTLYASHTTWDSEQAFVDWTQSQAFRDAHKNAGENRQFYIGGPQFEGFSVVI